MTDRREQTSLAYGNTCVLRSLSNRKCPNPTPEEAIDRPMQPHGSAEEGWVKLLCLSKRIDQSCLWRLENPTRGETEDSDEVICS